MSLAFSIYIPQDRRHAMALGRVLPDRMQGAALFADISGFTPLTETLSQALGAQRGAEELTALLNRVYGALIAEVERFGGSVIGFSGDAITCWFGDTGLRTEDRGLSTMPATQPSALSPQHSAALRAVACALAMQRAMAPLVTVGIRAEVVARLAIKVAVAVGPVRRFLVGDPQFQCMDVLVGRTLDRLAAAEHLAQRGEVVLCAEDVPVVAALLELAEWREADGARIAVVAGMRGEPPEAPWPALPDAAGVPEAARHWLAAEVADRLAIGTDHFFAELRQVTALFLSFGGIDYDGDRRAGALLDAYVRHIQAVIARFEGCLIQLTIGDKGSYLYAAFGAPRAHDDDVARAVAAALELRQPPPQLAAVQDVRIGVAQGWMYAGAYGSPTRRTYGVLGDPANLAARLMSIAPPEAIYCDESVARGARRRLTFDALPPVHLKGKRDPIPVYQPTGAPAQGVGSAVLRDSAALVGRAAEIAWLERAVAAVRAGGGRILCIEGEAGIGKTRLLAELARMVRDHGLAPLLGIGQSIEQHTPYRAWRDIFSAFFGLAVVNPEERRTQVERIAHATAPETLPRLALLNDVLNLDLAGTPLTVGLDPALRQESLAGLLIALLQARARERPLVLMLEDAHWLDSLSWNLAVQVARALLSADAPFLLVFSHRPLDTLSSGERSLATLRAFEERSETLSLAALEPDAMAALVAARLGLPGRAVPDTLAALVRARADGNPFFAEELLSNLLDRGLITLERSAAQGEPPTCVLHGDADVLGAVLPDTIQGLILSRIDRLPPDRQLILKVAAVIGHSFSYGALHATLNRYTTFGERALHAFLGELSRRDFTVLEGVQPEPTYVFKHAITQQVAYDRLLFAQRKEVHRAVAEWYERTYGDTETRDTRYETRDTRQGMDLSSPVSLSPYYPLLVHHYHHAEEFDRERRYALLSGESAAARFANVEAVRYLGRALELTSEDNLAERFDLLARREAVNDLRAERQAQASDLAELEALAARMGDDTRRARVALRRATYLNELSRYNDAVVHVEAAVRDMHAAADAAGEAAAYLQWGRALGLLGQPTEARARYQRALELAQAAGQAREEAHSTRALAHVALDLEEIDQARSAYQRAIALSRASADRRGEVIALGTLAWVYWMQGDYLRSREIYHESLVLAREIGLRSIEGRVIDGLGTVATALGDYAGARLLHEQALAIFRAIGDRQCESEGLSNIALILHAEGDPSAAELAARAAQLAHESGARRYESRALVILGHTLTSLGRLDEAAAAYAQSLALRRALGQLYLALEPQAGLAQVALARGKIASALAHVETILADLDQIVGRGWAEPYWVIAVCIRVLRAAGDLQAEDMLHRARAKLLAHAQSLRDEELRRAFLENIATHRELLADWQNMSAPTRAPWRRSPRS